MRRKELLTLILVVVLAVAVPLSGCAAPAPAPAPAPTPAPAPAPTPAPAPAPTPPPEAEVYHFKMQTLYGPYEAFELLDPFLKELSVALDGRATWKLHSANEIMPNEEMFHAVQTGTLDFAMVCGSMSGVPVDLGDLTCVPPFQWDSNEEALAIFHTTEFGELYAQAFEDLGDVRFIGFIASDPAHIISARPVEKYEDLQGMVIDTCKSLAAPLEAAGVTAQDFPNEERYLAGKTGMLDAVGFGGAVQAHSNKWEEVFPYFLTNPLTGACTGEFVANAKVWDSLPSDMQAIIKMGFRAYALDTQNFYVAGEKGARKFFIETTLSPEDVEKLRVVAMAHWDEIAKISPRCRKVIEILKGW